MPNRLRLKITGVDELRHAITRYGAALVSEAGDAVAAAVEDTIREARAAVPVVTGELQRSIRGTVRTDGYAITGRVRAGAEYAHVVEFGSERATAKPYLMAAAIANRRELNARLRANVIANAPEGLGTPRITGEGPSTPQAGID